MFMVMLVCLLSSLCYDITVSYPGMRLRQPVYWITVLVADLPTLTELIMTLDILCFVR